MLRREKKSNYMPGNLKKQRKISKQQRSVSTSQAPSTPAGYSLPVLLTTSVEYNANRDNLERLKVAGMIH